MSGAPPSQPQRNTGRRGHAVATSARNVDLAATDAHRAAGPSRGGNGATDTPRLTLPTASDRRVPPPG